MGSSAPQIFDPHNSARLLGGVENRKQVTRATYILETPAFLEPP